MLGLAVSEPVRLTADDAERLARAALGEPAATSVG